MQKIVKWIADGDVHKFYTSSDWINLSRAVRKDDKNECQICKHKYKRYSAASLVHHVKHLRDYPELGLSKTYVDVDGIEKRNLISVCKECHEVECHPERMGVRKEKNPLTEERWD